MMMVMMMVMMPWNFDVVVQARELMSASWSGGVQKGIIMEGKVSYISRAGCSFQMPAGFGGVADWNLAVCLIRESTP
jgi:hypothetical protein